MANKLTKEKLDLLIEQVLNEVTTDVKDINLDSDFLIEPEEKTPDERLSNTGINDKFKMSGTKKAANDVSFEKQAGENDRKAANRVYNQTLKDISVLDGDETDISYKDVLKGLKTQRRGDRNKNINTVSGHLRSGNKFRKAFDYALANSLVNKFILKPENAAPLNQIKSKIDNGEIITNEMALAGLNVLKKLEKSYNRMNLDLPSGALKSVINRRATGDIERLKDVMVQPTRIMKSHNSAVIQNKIEASKRENINYQEAAELLAFYKGIKDIDSAILPETYKTQLLKGIKALDYYTSLKKADATSSEFEMPEEEGGTPSKERKTGAPVGELKTTYSDLSPSNATFENAEVKEIYNLSLDPSYIATLNAVKGNSMLDKIKNISEFSQNINENLNKMHLGEAASNLRFLGFLSDAAREYEDASAGTVFETFLAAVSKGLIIGGESGATDIVTLSEGKPIYYSAKLYSSDQIGQSDQAETGFTSVVEKAKSIRDNIGLIYVIGIKTNLPSETLKIAQNISFSETTGSEKIGEAKTPTAIAFCVLNIKTNESGDYEVEALSNGKAYKIEKEVEKKDSKIKLNKIMTEVKNNNYWFSYCPIFFGVEEVLNQSAKTGSDWIKNKIEEFGSEGLKALAASYSNLQEMDLLGQEHTANASKEGGLSALENINYISRIQKEYTDFKNNYNKVIDVVRPSGDKASKQITENKKINKKSPKELDKLIERVIIYNMNK